jgi:outer membrane protein
MKKYVLLISMGFLAIQVSVAQLFDPLIKKAWAKDENLKSKNFQLESATIALREAKSMYGPTVGFGLQYTLAAGGRSIPFPIGDLFNPVYTALNNITQTNNFKQVENVEVNFLPNNFYDAKFSVQQPIFYPDIAINRSLKSEQLTMKSLEIKAYRRLISKEVMTAAINTAMASEAIKIYDEAADLLTEANRSTSSMVKNGVALPSALSRINAQIADVNAQTINAKNDRNNANLYLQYLTDDTLSSTTKDQFLTLPQVSMTSKQREELDQLDVAQNMLVLAQKKEHQFYLPKVGAQMDFGSQAFNFGFTPYVLLGINMQMNLFDNNRHKMRLQQSKLALDENNAKKSQVARQFELQLSVSRNNLQSSIDQANTYQPRIDAAKKVYKEVYAKYKEGSANYIELLDAQTQVTNAALQYNIAKYNAWHKWADHIYHSAAYPID